MAGVAQTHICMAGVAQPHICAALRGRCGTNSHTIFHTQLCHTPSFTHNFVNHHLRHHLSHTTLSHTIFHTQLCHTLSFTHNFVNHHLSHSTLSQTIFHISHLPSFAAAGVAQPQICGTLRGRRGRTSHPPSFCVAGVALMALALCVAGVAQPHIWGTLRGRCGTTSHLRHFAWQVWHKLTSTIVLRGRPGTISHPPSFRVAGVALMALGGALGLAWSQLTPVTPRHFAWQAWHNHTSTFVSRGGRGTISHPPSFRVAGVALIALGGAPFRVAGVALGLVWSHLTPAMPRHFAWQARHNLTSIFVLRGRCGTISHPPSFRVAGLALMALGGALGLAWSPVTPVTPWHFAWQASRGTISHPPSFRVAGVALMALGGAPFRAAGVALGLAWSPVTPVTPVTPMTPRHFAWQAWHNLTSIFVLRGRCGTISHPPSFRVAGLALMALGGALGLWKFLKRPRYNL